MINQNCEEYKKWIAFQYTNPPRAIGTLEKVNPINPAQTVGRCCLGNACFVNIPETRKVTFYGTIRYGIEGNASDCLPRDLAKQLNLTALGIFTKHGRRFVRIWLRENHLDLEFRSGQDFTNLAQVNDYAQGIDHVMIGELLEHLAMVERVHGIECFEPFPASLYNL